MGFEAYDIAEVKYQDEIVEMDIIAYHVYRGNRGHFLKAIAYAWTKTDPSNKRILLPAWKTIVTKYDLMGDVP